MQTSFLLQLKDALPAHISANRWLAELLGIDETTASRKFKGSVNLSTNELGLILEKLPQLSSATLPEGTNEEFLFGEFVHFTSIDGVMPYLEKVRNTFKIAVAENYQLHYFGRDLPIFHFFSQLDLFKFKVALWCNDVSPKCISKIKNELFEVASEIYDLYLKIDSQEVWYRNILKNQMYQLQYYLSINKIESEDLKALLAGYKNIVDQVESWCKDGIKKNGRYHLGISDYATLNSGGLLCKSDTPARLMCALSSVFFVSTSNNKAMENFNREFGFHKQQAISISAENERSRFKFISQLRKTLNKAS